MAKPSTSVVLFSAALGAVCALAEAAAQPAPITYAARPAPSAQANTSAAVVQQYAALPGGGAGSYGYGNARNSGEGVLDLTRPTARRAADPDLTAPPQDSADLLGDDDGTEVPTQSVQTVQTAAAPVQRPDWLEQERIGPPYEANGRTYVPTPEPGYAQTGAASWYGPGFHGQSAAAGEQYDQEAMTAAHPTLPLQSLVQVTNLQNGREAILRVTDRGPFVGGRLIDVSRRAADTLGFEANGTTRVHVRYLGPAPRRVTAEQGAAVLSSASTQSPAPAPFISTPLRPAPVDAAPAEPQQQAASGAYVVQVGAFSDLTNAHRARAALEGAGEVLVEPRQTASGELFRVRVVGYPTRAAAETARQQVADLGYPQAIVAAR